MPKQVSLAELYAFQDFCYAGLEMLVRLSWMGFYVVSCCLDLLSFHFSEDSAGLQSLRCFACKMGSALVHYFLINLGYPVDGATLCRFFSDY